MRYETALRINFVFWQSLSPLMPLFAFYMTALMVFYFHYRENNPFRSYLFLKIACLLWAALVVTPVAKAQSCTGQAARVELACHTWTEINKALKTGTTTVIVPIGGTEQSGPYIAVGKHNVRVHYLADEIASRIGNSFVAPVIAYVPEGSTTPRGSHMRFPGTLSISPSVFEGLIIGAAESLQVQGFEKIVFLGDHGGYQSQLDSIVKKLETKWKKSGIHARILNVQEFYNVVPGAYAQKLTSMGFGYAVGKHAEISDTSLMLAVDSSLVRLEALKQASKPTIEDGVYGGDPRPATAGLGRIGINMQLDSAVKSIDHFNRSSK